MMVRQVESPSTSKTVTPAHAVFMPDSTEIAISPFMCMGKNDAFKFNLTHREAYSVNIIYTS